VVSTERGDLSYGGLVALSLGLRVAFLRHAPCT
jgi:hypothetical protein